VVTRRILSFLFASTVFGITQRNTTREMVRYGAYCFSLFVAGVIAAFTAFAAVLSRHCG